jgi:FixJ family two-component response regulator
VTDQVPIVYLVDDDPSLLRALGRLLGAAGFKTRSFVSPVEFLDKHDPKVPGCVVLDLAMPEINGLEIQNRLAAMGRLRPIIFMTGHGDIPTSVSAMKAGALDFLTKPFDEQALIAAVTAAIAKDRSARVNDAELEEMRRRLSLLTSRQRQVVAGVVRGQLNKQIAGELAIREKTVKVHRGRALAKLGVRSVAELVRVAGRLGIVPAGAASKSKPQSKDSEHA